MLGNDYTNRMDCYDIERKADLCSIFLIDSSNFLILTPSHYYACSKGGYGGVAFRIGNQVYPFQQFDLQFNRPDIVLERIALAPQELIKSYRKAYEKRLKKMNFKEEMFNQDFHLPSIKILTQNLPFLTEKKVYHL